MKPPPPPPMRVCRRCNELLPIASFRLYRPSRPARYLDCVPCQSAMRRERYENEPQERLQILDRNKAWQLRQPPTKRRARHLMRKYGLTTDDFDALIESQGGGCAICDAKTSGSRGFHVDHDHNTGAVRGVLCHACNTSLGLMGEDPKRLRKAVIYLESFTNTEASA